ncbi:arylsulfotransferase family protein [Chelativorans salis]|uniref:Arylsulfotransferase family protein n=1 Tax=Chelativorans salis TaxID=2978478 RepID=A0ABT2LH16_9HYPH|nr:arylsulfotransferase family protein [Chelativorans sp. EGI FJ00035]MCT7373718.1 arylsulfotransferase family protein [Chelativorans sp. EGI FJ00035]
MEAVPSSAGGVRGTVPGIDRGYASRTLWILALLWIAVLLTAFHYVATLPWWLASPWRMADFNAAAPFQYRTLLPILVAGISQGVPWLDADLVFAAIEVGVWMLLIVVALRGLDFFCPDVSPPVRRLLAITVVIPVAMHLIVPDLRFSSTFQQEGGLLELGEWRTVRLFRYVYDLPAAVFTLALVILLARFERRPDMHRFAAYLGLFAVATLNRETTVCMIPAFLAVCYDRISRELLLKTLAAQVLVFAAVYGSAVWLIPNIENPHANVAGSEYENHLVHNLALFASPLYLVTYFARFGAGLYLPVLLLRRYLSPVLGRTLIWFGLPFLALAVYFGRLPEQRVVVEIMPIIWLAAVQAITAWNASHRGSAVSQLSGPRAVATSAPRGEAQGVAERAGTTAFVLMLMFLAFVGGAMVMQARVFPHQFFSDAYRAWDALRLQQRILSNPILTNLYERARTDERGVTIHNPARAFPGYTLFTSGDDQVARLVAMDGRVVHEWRLPYERVWEVGAAVAEPQPGSVIYMDRAKVFPNGDLLAIYISSADTPWGYGMVKMDRNSRVIWSYLDHVHHEMSIAPDGRIYTLVHQFNQEPQRGARQFDRPYLEDFLVELSPEGEELRRISLTEALVNSRYGGLLRFLPYSTLGDPLHPNNVKYIDAEAARNFPFGEEGDLLVSIREQSLLAVVSMETGEIKWAMTGAWLRQHDPSILPNGNILMFDNLGGLDGGNSSRVIEIDPRTSNIEWSFGGTSDHPLYSFLRSNAERLPNGNTLITESDGGRLLEVTREGDVVWSYVNPIRRGDRQHLIPIINGAQRIGVDYFEPGFRHKLAQPAAPRRR